MMNEEDSAIDAKFRAAADEIFSKHHNLFKRLAEVERKEGEEMYAEIFGRPEGVDANPKDAQSQT